MKEVSKVHAVHIWYYTVHYMIEVIRIIDRDLLKRHGRIVELYNVKKCMLLYYKP